ncbi:unnamed protein product [Victoria cruziana]
MLDGDQNAEECTTMAAGGVSSLPLRKRLLAGLKHEVPSPPPDSVSAVEPEPASARDPNLGRSRARYLPNLSECHGCSRSGTLSAGPGGGRKLQMLKSGWRVVLLCRSCVAAIDYGQVCSYCFSKISEALSVFSCVDCRRLVHRECGSLQRNCASNLESQSFVCVDCWVPNYMVKVRNRGKAGPNGLKNTSPELPQTDETKVPIPAEQLIRARRCLMQSQGRALSDACSAKGSKSSVFGGSGLPVKKVVREAKSETEMAVAVTTLAKEKTLGKTESAKEAAVLPNGALNVVVALAAVEDNTLRKGYSPAARHCSSNDDGNKEVDGGITDEELALQLHRAMNSSPRIWKNNYVNRELSSLKEGRVYTYRKRDSNSVSNLKRRRNIDGLLDKQNVCSKNDSGDSSKSESGSYSICGRFEACTEDKLFENPDRPEAEVSVCLGPSIGAEPTHPDNTKAYKTNHGTWKIDGGCDAAGEEAVAERFLENGVDSFEVHRLSDKNTKLDAQAKEEQASCSNKPANSSGDDDSLDMEFESCQNQNIALSVGDDESVHCEDESLNHGNKLYRTVDESCSSQAQDRMEPSSSDTPRKYSRRCLSIEGSPHRKTDPLSEELVIENQA